MNIINILVMVLVGAVSGTLAYRLVRGSDSGFVMNAIVGIIGAVVGGAIFDFFGFTPGEGVARSLSTTFGVEVPANVIGMIISSTLGAVLILYLANFFKRGRRR